MNFFMPMEEKRDLGGRQVVDTPDCLGQMTQSIIDQLLICQSYQKPVVNVPVKLDCWITWIKTKSSPSMNSINFMRHGEHVSETDT